jgi:hypothetical protein
VPRGGPANDANFIEKFALKIYHVLLQAYPADFRRSYGPLMLQHFSDCYSLASQKRSYAAFLGFWMDTLADLVLSALLERLDKMRTRRWWFWGLVVLLGLVTGAIDYTASEVQATLLVLLPIAFCCGFAAPRLAWRCAVLLGLAIPAVHVIGHAFNIHPPYHDYVIASLLALIPAFLAAYSGVGLRWLAVKGLGRIAGS